MGSGEGCRIACRSGQLVRRLVPRMFLCVSRLISVRLATLGVYPCTRSRVREVEQLSRKLPCSTDGPCPKVG